MKLYQNLKKHVKKFKIKDQGSISQRSIGLRSFRPNDSRVGSCGGILNHLGRSFLNFRHFLFRITHNYSGRNNLFVRISLDIMLFLLQELGGKPSHTGESSSVNFCDKKLM